jgi:biopolymer transport protein ExbB
MQDPVSYLLSSAGTLVELGGPVVAVQIAISVVGLALVLYKFFQYATLGSGRLEPLRLAIAMWQSGDREQSDALLRKSPLAIAVDIRFGLSHLESAPRDSLRDELARRGTQFVKPYGSLLRSIELIYYLSPVLGLLGTVLGMIDAFRELAAVAGSDQNSNALAAGIWEALLTTAVGLVIAVPFTVFHAMLETRYERLSDACGDLLTRVMTAKVV